MSAAPTSTEIERVLLGGDLAKLAPDNRLAYYNQVCTSLGLNPLTKPFEYIVLNGKMQLYARKDCTDQLRKIWGVSVDTCKHDFQEKVGLYVVTAEGHDATGRKDTGTGAVSVAKLTGDALANAIMKAETKAKRRLTLSICGLGMLDETELETIKGAKPPVGAMTNRIVSGEVLDIKVFDQAGCTIIAVGEDKLTIRDLGIDSLLANCKGKTVELECAETHGPKGKFWEVLRVLKINNYDYTLKDDLTPQLQASLDAAEEMKKLDAIEGRQQLETDGECQSPEMKF